MCNLKVGAAYIIPPCISTHCATLPKHSQPPCRAAASAAQEYVATHPEHLSSQFTADGSLLDAALLAAVAALRSLQLPAVAVNEEGAVVPSSEPAAAADTQPDSRWAALSLVTTCMF